MISKIPHTGVLVVIVGYQNRAASIRAHCISKFLVQNGKSGECFLIVNRFKNVAFRRLCSSTQQWTSEPRGECRNHINWTLCLTKQRLVVRQRPHRQPKPIEGTGRNESIRRVPTNRAPFRTGSNGRNVAANGSMNTQLPSLTDDTFLLSCSEFTEYEYFDSSYD